jgi:hypothetical protein
MTWLVFKGLNGNYIWAEKFAVGSIEEFVELRNKGARHIGAKRDIARINGSNVVTEMTWDGDIIGTYHPCAEEPDTLL